MTSTSDLLDTLGTSAFATGMRENPHIDGQEWRFFGPFYQQLALAVDSCYSDKRAGPATGGLAVEF